MSRDRPEYKVVLVGDKSVGKTSLVLRFIDGCFQPNQPPTIGAHFFSKHIALPRGKRCVLQVWDTAGQERFRAMAPMYYREAVGAIVCYDSTNEKSFEMMQVLGWWGGRGPLVASAAPLTLSLFPIAVAGVGGGAAAELPAGVHQHRHCVHEDRSGRQDCCR